jgi:hypothetical protein
VDFNASLMLGGQIKGEMPRLFSIYSAGNFIEATAETSYFQIGESKYGKPIIDRVVRRSSSLNEAAKAALVSMDSTIRSNLSVGLPLDLVLLKRDQYEVARHVSIDDDNAYFPSAGAGARHCARFSCSCRSRTGCAADSTAEGTAPPLSAADPPAPQCPSQTARAPPPIAVVRGVSIQFGHSLPAYKLARASRRRDRFVLVQDSLRSRACRSRRCYICNK